MKFINLFLASSLDEFANERMELGDYIRSLNDIYAERDIYFKLFICEDASNAVAKVRKQEEYNRQIRESQFFYIILGKSAGEYTVEEFDVAFEKFQKDGTPKLYTYFRTLPEGETPEQGVRNFMQRLDKLMGHYYSTFTHLDSIKLNMLLEMTRDPELLTQVKFQDGQVLVDEKPLSAISLENVPIYSKNETVQRMKAELERLKMEFTELAAALGKNPADMELYKKLSDCGEQRAKLTDQLHQLEMDILNLCRTVSKQNEEERQMTWREREALRLVSAGNYDGALNILRDAQRERELEQAEEIANAGLERIRGYIAEEQKRIDILEAKGVSTETLSEIYDSYEKAVALAKKHHIERDVLYNYAAFLMEQHEYDRSIATAEHLRKWFEQDGAEDDAYATVLNTLGKLYRDKNDFAKAESLYREALKIYRRLAECNPAAYEGDVAGMCNNLALLLSRTNRMEEAEALYREALKIYRRLAKSDPATYEEKVAGTCNNLAILLSDINRVEEAEQLYCEALEIYRQLAERNSAAYEGDVAMACNNLALLLSRTNRMEETEQLYCEALKIYRRMAKSNPAAYDENVAMTCNNLALSLSRTNRVEEAEALYCETLEIYRRLAKSTPAAYESYVAQACNNLASLLDGTNRMEKAEQLYREALEIRRRLAKRNPEAYEVDVAKTCNNLAILLDKTNRVEESEALYREALEIRRRLAGENSAAYEGGVAKTCNNLAILLDKTNRVEESEALYREALEIRRRLAERNPAAYEGKVADTCNNLAILLYNSSRVEEAEQLFRKALDIYEKYPHTARNAQRIRAILKKYF